MVRFNSDVVFVDTSGQVRVLQGDLTLRANPNGDGHIIIGSGLSLRPDTNEGLDLGQDFLRWRTIYASGGNFEDMSVDQNNDQVAFRISNNGTNRAVWITQNTNNEAMRITQTGSNIGLIIDKTEATFGNALQINNAGFRDGLEINQAGNGIAIEVNQAGDVVAASIDKTSTGVGVGLRVINAGIDEGVTIKMLKSTFASNAHSITTTRVANSGFNFGEYFSDDGSDAKFRFRGDGALFSDITGATPADYAEYFETEDPSGIAMGYAVKINANGLLEIATSGEAIIGFTSAAPAVAADTAWANWHDKYLKTDFGAYQLDETGDRILNPVWNSGLAYNPREERPEWIAVGLLGKIWARAHDETLLPGDFVTLGANGMVTKATIEEPRWQVTASGIAFDSAKGYGTARILYK